MHRTRPTYLILIFCCLFLPAATFVGEIPAAHSSAIPAIYSEDFSSTTEATSLPKAVMDLMRASRTKYVDGSNLIKTGDSEKAREAFNQSVDMLLQSDWDIKSTPALDRYFQQLVQQIQEDESRYLLAPCDTQEEVETAVVDELDKLDLVPIAVDPALSDTLSADLSKTKYDIPITMNEMVAKSLDYWLNGGRKYFVDGLLRSGQYRPIIEKIFREESIPLDLMYLAQVESLFRPHAVSKAQAKGIWQFEKGTAIRYGLKVTRDVDERSDPEKSTRAAARYLNDLFGLFKDWNLALAAYNWGEGKVQRLVDSTGLKDFWQLVDLRRRLPKETKNHIPLIQASVILAKNPDKFGLPTELDPPLTYAEVSVSKPIDLRAAAKVLSTSIDELKKLNPALKGFTTPANYPNYQLKVPADSDPRMHDQLASLPTVKVRIPEEFNCRHKVRNGDTLARIAARYNVSASELERANGISSKKKLVAGTWLLVPSKRVVPEKEKRMTKAKTNSGSGKLVAVKNRSARAKTPAAKSQVSGRTGGAQSKKSRPATIKSASSKHPLELKKSATRQTASK
jgi:membrane-bound lytic murein transglycosylase D